MINHCIYRNLKAFLYGEEHRMYFCNIPVFVIQWSKCGSKRSAWTTRKEDFLIIQWLFTLNISAIKSLRCRTLTIGGELQTDKNMINESSRKYYDWASSRPASQPPRWLSRHSLLSIAKLHLIVYQYSINEKNKTNQTALNVTFLSNRHTLSVHVCKSAHQEKQYKCNALE